MIFLKPSHMLFLRVRSARFATLAWSEMATKQADFSYGLIAGGMGDGTVRVWDPAKLVASHPQPQVRVCLCVCVYLCVLCLCVYVRVCVSLCLCTFMAFDSVLRT